MPDTKQKQKPPAAARFVIVNEQEFNYSTLVRVLRDMTTGKDYLVYHYNGVPTMLEIK